MHTRTRGLQAAVLAAGLLAACQFSTTSGQAGKADYTASECGAPLNGVTGCDLKRPLAVGGRVSVTATSKRTGTALALSSSDPRVLGVTQEGSGAVLLGAAPGQADLIAFDPVDRDVLSIQVASIAQLAYSELSSGSGTFALTPGADADGSFEVNKGIKTFSLIFGQVDASGAPLLGREALQYELPAGLTLTQDRAMPTGVQFDFNRPAPGSYPFTVRARVGTAQFKMKIVVKD